MDININVGILVDCFLAFVQLFKVTVMQVDQHLGVLCTFLVSQKLSVLSGGLHHCPMAALGCSLP